MLIGTPSDRGRHFPKRPLFSKAEADELGYYFGNVEDRAINSLQIKA